MNWNTIYITGKSDFREEVRKKLMHSDLNFMPGYIEGSTGRTTHDLYWLDERTDLRAFKQAVGSKLIWKFRLRFFACLEDFIQSRNSPRNTELTEEDLNLIASMRGVKEG